MGYPKIVHTEEGMREGLQIDLTAVRDGEPLRALGEVTVHDRTPPELVAARCAEADIVIFLRRCLWAAWPTEWCDATDRSDDDASQENCASHNSVFRLLRGCRSWPRSGAHAGPACRS